MNKSILIGRLVADPMIKYSNGENQIAIVNFTVAVDKRIKKEGEQTADFINCIAFGKTGEFIGKYFNKGKKIGIVGRIQSSTYTRDDGTKKYKTEVVVEEVEFVSKKDDDNNSTLNDKKEKEDFSLSEDFFDDIGY